MHLLHLREACLPSNAYIFRLISFPFVKTMLRKKLNKAILKNSALLLLIACLSKCNPQDQGENFNPLFKYFRNFLNENIHPIF